MLPVGQQSIAHDATGERTDAGAAVRRVGRLFRHHGQPGAGHRGGHPRAHGGTAILSETPEIYGAEHLLTRRAKNREVGQKLDRDHPLVGRLRRSATRWR